MHSIHTECLSCRGVIYHNNATKTPLSTHQHSVSFDTSTKRTPISTTAIATASSSSQPLATTTSKPPPPPRPLLIKPEILAPAGNYDTLKAAIEAGADAIYFGSSAFNARARATNFNLEEIPNLVQYCHDRGVKCYITINTLIFDSELPDVEALARQCALAGVDAVIIQDMGAVELLRRAAPSLPLHASTQMTITTAEAAEFAFNQGIDRVVLGRELSIKEIEKVAGNTQSEVEVFVHGALCVSYSGQCFSSEAWGGRSANRGQCAQACRLPYGLVVDGTLMNITDDNNGSGNGSTDVSYLLSPQDLAGVELIPDLIKAGVHCLKIEGRLKGPEYVSVTTAMYRKAVDKAWERLDKEEDRGNENESSSSSSSQLLSESEWNTLRQVFARGQDANHLGLTPGFLLGPQHQSLVRGRAPRHRGNYMGKVVKVEPKKNRVLVEMVVVKGGIRRGDGVVFDGGRPEMQEEGGSVYNVEIVNGSSNSGGKTSRQKKEEEDEKQLVWLYFGREKRLNVQPGHLIWKTSDQQLLSDIRSRFNKSSKDARRLPVKVTVSGGIGEHLVVCIEDEDGNVGTGSSVGRIEAAQQRPLTEDDVKKAVGVHLGGGGESSLIIADMNLLTNTSSDGIFLPAAEIKEARRRAVEAFLEQRRRSRAAANLPSLPVLPQLLQDLQQRNDNYHHSTNTNNNNNITINQHGLRLRVLCRSMAQVDAAVKIPWVNEIMVDFLEVHGLKEACATVKAAAAAGNGRKRLIVCTPRILKPGEHRLPMFYLRLQADALLVRGTGFLQQLLLLGGAGAVVPGLTPIIIPSGEGGGVVDGNESTTAPSSSSSKVVTIPEIEGDFSLNASNILSVDLLLNNGLSCLAPTHDCNSLQLQGLAQGLQNNNNNNNTDRSKLLEVILHHHLPIFHTEHCVFARTLSTGNSYLDCGRPCESHTVHLKDTTTGKDHLLVADEGCRNTLFNAEAQSGLPYLPELVEAGYRIFRVELMDEPAEAVRPLLEGYKKSLDIIMNSNNNNKSRKEWMNGRNQKELWNALHKMRNANGDSQGVGVGSLKPVVERERREMKPTAASMKEKKKMR